MEPKMKKSIEIFHRFGCNVFIARTSGDAAALYRS
jgi:hypothetical protein